MLESAAHLCILHLCPDLEIRVIIEYEHPAIVTLINDAISKGHEDGRPVKRILLSPVEWSQFYQWASGEFPDKLFYRTCTYRGVTVQPQ